MRVRISILMLATATWLGCAAPPPEAAEELRQRALELAHDALIVDTHVDVPYRMKEMPMDVASWTSGDFDHPRAMLGGLDAPCMSIYVPASYQESGGAYELANELIDMVEGIADSAPEKFGIARSTAEGSATSP